MRLPLHEQRRDALIAAAVWVAMVVELLPQHFGSGNTAVDLFLLALIATPIALRRRAPLAAWAGLFASVTLTDLVAFHFTRFSTLIAAVVLVAFTAGRELEANRAPAVFAIGFVGVQAVNLSADETLSVDNVVFPMALIAAAWAIGQALRSRARLARELAHRAEELDAERQANAAAAVAQERRRIARELHDVVAHSVSVMVVQSGAARRTLRRDPARALEALGAVEDTGRVALGELRRLLGYLATDVGGNGDGAPAAILSPQPTLADLEALVRRAREAGLAVTLDVAGAPRALPAGVELAAYRIVQEALTNVIKHAPNATAAVRIGWTDGAVDLAVLDEGPATALRASATPGSGHGLDGMRERVAMYGGSLEAGPRGEGGFAVRARLPTTREAVGT